MNSLTFGIYTSQSQKLSKEGVISESKKHVYMCGSSLFLRTLDHQSLRTREAEVWGRVWMARSTTDLLPESASSRQFNFIWGEKGYIELWRGSSDFQGWVYILGWRIKVLECLI